LSNENQPCASEIPFYVTTIGIASTVPEKMNHEPEEFVDAAQSGPPTPETL